MRGWTIGIVFAAAMAGSVAGAQACSCVRETREQVMARVAVAFEGEVIAVRSVNGRRGVVGEVAVRRVFKGAPPTVVRVETAASSTVCGWPMAAGDRRTFGGVWGSNGHLQTNMCTMAPLQPRR